MKMPHWLSLVANLAAAVVLVLVIINPTHDLRSAFGLLLLAVGCDIAERFWAARR